ncbi:chorismate-binding protein [Chryseobacterium sp.]|uniref:chorismate-binding protein n=1 Tax=Chryseobacterium sp. TaxID=1871047 RepID=UPI0025BA9A80|nr:chorismate-binding protein [Chryseobacterium sp.]
MIFFKFPFNESLYTTDEKSDLYSVSFTSFNGIEEVHFNGRVTSIDPEELEKTCIDKQSLPIEADPFIPESKYEYLQKLKEVIEVIKENNLPKLVLSRRKIISNFEHLDVKESFKNLCNAYPNAFRYLFIKGEMAWIGAFSEVLGKFNILTHEFETMSLAATLPINEEWSEKEIEEQKPVTNYIENILRNYTNVIDISETYDHITGNIKHLRTDFKARINPEDLDKIIMELHPTPAVCGIPKDFCKEKIDEFEKFPRELYAGYSKISTENTIQYFVNLRCAKLFQNSVHLFVGGGITAQSNPEKEWMETELKSDAVLKNLVIA